MQSPWCQTPPVILKSSTIKSNFNIAHIIHQGIVCNQCILNPVVHRYWSKVAGFCIAVRDGTCRIPILSGAPFKVIINNTHPHTVEPYTAGSDRVRFSVIIEKCSCSSVTKDIIALYCVSIPSPQGERPETLTKSIVTDGIIAGFNGNIFRVAVTPFKKIIFDNSKAAREPKQR